MSRIDTMPYWIKMMTLAWGPEVAAAHARLPSVIFARHDFDRVESQYRHVLDTVPDFTGLPWEDAMVLFPFHALYQDEERTGIMLARVTRGDVWLQRADMRPWFVVKDEKHLAHLFPEDALPESRLICTAWSLDADDDEDIHSGMVKYALGLESIDRRLGARQRGRNLIDMSWPERMKQGTESREQWRKGIDHCCEIAGFLALYLSQCPEFIVEVGPAPAPPLKPRVAREKPWLVPRPSIVLMDPEHARRALPRTKLGGHHASPIPHGRRGHWKLLTAERYYRGYDPTSGLPYSELFDPTTNPRRVFTRPTVVGDSEWIHEGTRYRILNAEKDTHGT